jgi:hypothetical protein
VREFYCELHRYNPPANSGFCLCPMCEAPEAFRKCPKCGLELRQDTERYFFCARCDKVWEMAPAVLARDHRANLADLCELQGLPRAFDLPGLSRSAKYRAIGNGVPVPMARAVAAAIRDREVTRGVRTCSCGCGRPVTGREMSAGAACRKRIERKRKGLGGHMVVGSVTPRVVTEVAR